jgi:L-amino acid N-acyltransferase YncA
MKKLNFVEVTHDNAAKVGMFCIKNPQYPGFKLKQQWLSERNKEGLKLKLLKKDEETFGFIEYVPIEYAWRPVTGRNYLFIHCLWVFPKKNYKRGFGSQLLQHVVEDAKHNEMNGVAAFVSSGSWMSDKALFLKNGFDVIATKGRFDLVVNKFNLKPLPEFIKWEENLKKYNGLNLVYANQCPLFIKSVEEMKETAKSFGLKLEVKILDSAAKAQQAPSGYGVYNLVYEGKLLADHYISNTRFKNIITKEIMKK